MPQIAHNVYSNPEVTRVEVIDDRGRAYMNYDAKDVQLHYQDEQRTLKIFLKGWGNVGPTTSR